MGSPSSRGTGRLMLGSPSSLLEIGRPLHASAPAISSRFHHGHPQRDRVECGQSRSDWYYRLSLCGLEWLDSMGTLLLIFSVVVGSRSEERRVGKECRAGWSLDHYKKK